MKPYLYSSKRLRIKTKVRQLHTYECREVAALFYPRFMLLKTAHTRNVCLYVDVIHKQKFPKPVDTQTERAHALNRSIEVLRQTSHSKNNRHNQHNIPNCIRYFRVCLFYFHLNIFLNFKYIRFSSSANYTFFWLQCFSVCQSNCFVVTICVVDFNLIQFTSSWWRKGLQLGQKRKWNKFYMQIEWAK